MYESARRGYACKGPRMVDDDLSLCSVLAPLFTKAIVSLHIKHIGLALPSGAMNEHFSVHSSLYAPFIFFASASFEHTISLCLYSTSSFLLWVCWWYCLWGQNTCSFIFHPSLWENYYFLVFTLDMAWQQLQFHIIYGLIVKWCRQSSANIKGVNIEIRWGYPQYSPGDI